MNSVTSNNLSLEYQRWKWRGGGSIEVKFYLKSLNSSHSFNQSEEKYIGVVYELKIKMVHKIT